MSSFKSPQLLFFGRIRAVVDTCQSQASFFYLKAQFIEGQDWKLQNGRSKFETFESCVIKSIAPIQHPFNLHYTTASMKGWPRLLIEVWSVDKDGRHSIFGYGTTIIPMGSGDYELDVTCWRPSGSFYDNIIGANSELQFSGIIGSPLSRYGLVTTSTCIVQIEINVIGRNFQLHGITR